MSQCDALAKLIGKLDAAGIPHMLAGSIGSGFHGEPRATNDIDIVIAPSGGQLRAFVASLGEDYYVSPEAAEEALRRRSMFNVIDLDSGWKTDLIVRKDRPYSLEEFDRRIRVTVREVELCVLSPEDSILSKLEWAARGESERQARDALGVVVAQRAHLDLAYLRKWALELGIDKLLEEILASADEALSGRGDA